MEVRFSDKFKIRLRKLPKKTREKFYKQADFLIHDLRHPSLRAKKYEESTDTWQARVDDDYRFYFWIIGDAYILLDIKKHPK